MDIENNITINISVLLGVDIISTIIKLKIRSIPYINSTVALRATVRRVARRHSPD